MSDIKINNTYFGKGQNSDPTLAQKILNPESYLINKVLGSDGDEKFKSYLNPLCSYSVDPNDNFDTTFFDPLMKTVDANIGGTHFLNLNPVANTFNEHASVDTKIRSWVDPGMACATSFIKNEKVAKAVYTILNPIGGIVSGVASGIAGLFKKD